MKKLILTIVMMSLMLSVFVVKAYCGAQEDMDAGDAYLKQSKFDEAIIEYRKVVDNYPTDPLAPEALLTIGACYGGLYKWEDSITSLVEVINEYPNSTQAISSYFLVGSNYLTMKDTDTAIYWLKQRVELYPEKSTDTMKAYFYLGEAYFRKGDYDKSLTAFQKIANDYPNSATVKSQSVNGRIADCYQRLDRVVEAIDLYEIVYSTGDPREIKKDMCAFQIAWLYEYLKNYVQAKIWYQKVVDEYPNSWYVRRAKNKLKELQNK